MMKTMIFNQELGCNCSVEKTQQFMTNINDINEKHDHV